jgi:hypothetical protein
VTLHAMYGPQYLTTIHNFLWTCIYSLHVTSVFLDCNLGEFDYFISFPDNIGHQVWKFTRNSICQFSFCKNFLGCWLQLGIYN